MSRRINLIILCLLIASSVIPIHTFAQQTVNEENIISRYKQILLNKPKEGSTFDRVYQFYLEGNGLDEMLNDYEAEAQENPNNANIQLILGHIYKHLGKDKQATTSYQRAVELSPDNYYTHFALGDLYKTLRQYEEAIKELSKAAELSEKGQNVPPEELTSIYQALGHAYFHRDRVDEAIQAWQKIAELDLHDIFARIELAELFREQELYQQAIAQHEEIIKLKKDDPYRVCLSHREIGNILETKGDFQDAINRYDTALRITAQGNWLRRDIQHRIIGIFATESNWDGLIKYYKEKLDENPNDPELLGLLAAAYIENQQLDEGINTYRKGLELSPTDTDLRLNLIASLRYAEKFDEAATEYEALSKQDPDNIGIYRELGELYYQTDNPEKAKQIYQRMIDRSPDNPSTHLTLAEIYAGHESLDEAITHYEKALSLAPNNLDYIEYYGDFYLRQGNREKALETWNRMVANDKTNAANYDRLAKLLKTKNFKSDAIEAMRKAVELIPEEYSFRETLAKYLTNNNEFDKALVEYNAAMKLAPNQFFADKMNDKAIELYRRQGTLTEKVKELEKELENHQISETARFAHNKQLTKMYLKMGNISYAMEVLLNAKQEKPNDITINRWLVDLYNRQGRRNAANAIYSHLIEIDSANSREYYTKITKSYLNILDFDAATDTAKQVIANSPRNPDGHQLLAQIAVQSENYDSAIDSLKNAIRLRPEDIKLRIELAKVYILAEKPQHALAQFWRCWNLSGNVNDKLILIKPLSEIYDDIGRPEELKTKLKKLARSNTSWVAAVLALSELQKMKGNMEDARFQLAQALNKQRDNPSLLFHLVLICLELEDIQEALTYQQQLVKVQPNSDNQQQLGEILFDLGREQEAIQVWTKLLHAKNQTLEAEVKLAALLLRNGLQEQAFIVLERAAEKITGTDAHLPLYQLGAMLVVINEPERATPYFHAILNITETTDNETEKVEDQSATNTYDINRNYFTVPRSTISNIQSKPIPGTSRVRWRPKTLDEAKVGSLVQLTTIAQQQGKLNELVKKWQDTADANPTDVNARETLARLYNLIQHHDKADTIIDKLLDITTNDTKYRLLRLESILDEELTPEEFKNRIAEIPSITTEERLLYIAKYAESLYQKGDKEQADKLISEIEDKKISNFDTVYACVMAYNLAEKPDIARKHLSAITPPQPPKQDDYRYLYENLMATYLRKREPEKAIDIYWEYLEKTKPKSVNPRRLTSHSQSSFSGSYSSIPTEFPPQSAYCNQDRLDFLEYNFRELWIHNQTDAIISKLQNELDATEGNNRIYPSLALSYCYWWDGKRQKAKDILTSLRNEFPDDLILKFNAACFYIQIGNIQEAMNIVEKLARVDVSKQLQYYELMLELATHLNDTKKLMQLIPNILNSSYNADVLLSFSETLDDRGFKQHAIRIALKAKSLVMKQRNTSLLTDLAYQLEWLGRGQDAAELTKRALQFSNITARSGRTSSSRNISQYTNLSQTSQDKQDNESKLVQDTQNKPDSFQAQLKLATHYDNTHQIEKASQAYKAALALRPKDNNTRLKYIRMLERTGKAVDAIPDYTILLRSNSSALNYEHDTAIDAYVDAGKLDELIAITYDIIMPVGQYAGSDFTVIVARRCLSENRTEDAIKLFEKVIQTHPSWTSLHQELAAIYVNAGQPEKAIQFLTEKQKSDRASLSDTEFVIKIAEIHQASGNSQRAVNYIKDKISEQEQSESTIPLVLKLADMYKNSDELHNLISEYETRLTENPNDSNILYILTTLKLKTDDNNAVKKLVDQIIEKANTPINAQWLYELSDACRGKELSELQFNLLEAAVEKLESENSWQLEEGLQKLAEEYLKKGDIENAQIVTRKMGNLKSMSDGWGRTTDKSKLATTYMQYQMWDDALNLYTEIINNIDSSYWERREAQEKYLQIKQRRGDLSVITDEELIQLPISLQQAYADEYESTGQVNKAIQIYKRIIKTTPEDYASQEQLAYLYTRIGQHDWAHQIWSQLLNVDPENTIYQDGLVKSLQSADKLTEAYQLTQQYIQEEPDAGVHYLRLAKLYADDNRIDDAITNYEKAIELAPGNRQNNLDLANIYLRSDNFVKAESAFNDALKFTTSSYQRRDIEDQILNIYRYQGKLDEKFKDLEAKGPLTSEKQAQIARHYQNTGDTQKSVEAFKKAIDMTSDTYEKNRLSNELLEIYVEHDQTDLATQLYERIAQRSDSSRRTSYGTTNITVSSDAIRSRDTMIRTYKNQNKLEKLKEIYADNHKKSPNNVEIIETLARINWESEDYKQSAEYYQMLYKIQPNIMQNYYYAAAAKNKSGHPEKANEILKQAETAFTSSPDKNDRLIVAHIASICLQNGMNDLALKHAQTALELSRGYGSSLVQETLWAMLGEIYKNKEQYEDAVNMYRQVAITTDYDYDRRNAESEIREITLQGKLYEKWIPKQLETVEKQPNNLNARLQLAESYELAKKVKQAVEQYEAIKELQPNNPKWYKKLAELYNNLPNERRETGEVIEGTTLSLNGNGSYVEIINSETLNNLTDQITVSAWFKCTEYPKDYSPIISKTDARDPEFKNRSYFLNLKGDGTIRFASSPKGQSDVNLFSSNAVVNLNTWTHIAGIVDAKRNTIRLIVDGIQIGSTNYKNGKSIFSSKLPLRIGYTQEEISGHTHVNGYIDEVRVWNIARSIEDIRADMNEQLKGDEPGLVGYWKFDTQQDDKIFDSSPNKNHGKLIGDAKLEKYKRPIFESIRIDNLEKSKSYFQKTLELEPDSYQNYNLLAKQYLKTDNKAKAEAIYLSALETPLSQSNYISAAQAISSLYSEEGQEQKLLAILEKIEHKLTNSANFYDQLATLYKKIGDTEKTEAATEKWLKIRQKEVNRRNYASSYRSFAEELLEKGIYPEIALMNAKLAVHDYTGTSYTYATTLGEACIANEKVHEALRHFKQALGYVTSNYGYNWFWNKVADTIEKVEDKEKYIHKLDELIHIIPVTNWANRANAYRLIAQYLSKNDTRENTENYIITKAGFVPESRWITLGPFKNIDTMGTVYAYIPEETTQIDPTAKYNGKDGLISWKKSDYRLLDGHYVFHGDSNDWSLAYVWTIVSSPKKQDIVMRFDSDDQGVIWLNGKQVFRHFRTSGTQMDRYKTPVTLNQGENTILVKISNSSMTWDFYLRLTDEDGNPIQGLTYKSADELLKAPPPEPTYHVNVHLGMAEYYYKNNMPDKALEEMKQTGAIHEYSWHILGPFDNKENIGYNTPYIPEDITQTDFKTKHEGVNGEISWRQHTDDAYDGFVDLGRDVKSATAYASVTINSPDNREMQLRFGSDDNGKVWLNGHEVITEPEGGWATLDAIIVPVKLNQGENSILVKVGNSAGSWGFFLRITDNDGKPFPDLNLCNLPEK